MKAKRSLVVFFSLSIFILFCACSRVQQPSDNGNTSTPTATFSPTATPTETPTPTPDTRIAVNRQNFSDSAFRDYILDHYDKDYDEMLSEEEIKAAKICDISNKGIESLRGIEYLSSLTELNCRGNKLTKLELTNHPFLRVLNCSENSQLTLLNLGESVSKIDTLNISKTKISSFPTQEAKNLRELYSQSSSLSKMVFCSNSPLEVLVCSAYDYDRNWGLSIGLDLAGCQNLRVLDCQSYWFTNRETQITLVFPKLQTLTLSDGNLVSLDITQCPELREVAIAENTASTVLKTISAKNLKKLTRVSVNGCYMPDYGASLKLKVDFSGCEQLIYFTANDVKEINLTGCKNIDKSYFWYDPYDGTKVIGIK